MKHPAFTTLLLVACLLSMPTVACAYPKPNVYPLSWELKFEHSEPKRILVTPKGGDQPVAYWYITYLVTNLSKEEQKFLPVFELLPEESKPIRSDSQIPAPVYDAIRSRERNVHLKTVLEIAGEIGVGEARAKEGMAVWKEPDPEMGQFTLFVTGLSGEAVILKDDKGNAKERDLNGRKEKVVLWKTLQIQYLMVGDKEFPGIDRIEKLGEEWIMR